jgi:ABC-type transport system involved in multi-copper enzyme maturation permease subunit
MASRAMAVARYTLVELWRRRVVLVFVVIALVLTAGLGIIPLVAPGFQTGEDRSLFLLTSLSRSAALAVEICAFAVGMTVINHDLDSGAIVAIFAKPVSRLAYAGGKLGAAAVALLFVDVIIAAGSMLVVALNGGGHMAVLFWFYAVTVANMLLVMVLVMILTVYLNNIVAAVIVFVFTFVQDFIGAAHAMVVNHVLSNAWLNAVINIFYWVLPHPLASNLQRDIIETQIRLSEARFEGRSPLDSIPGASGNGDIVYWLAYLAVLCVLLYLAVRRKQV